MVINFDQCDKSVWFFDQFILAVNRSRQEVVLASQNAYLIKVSCVKSWMDMMHYLLPGQEPGFEENSEVYNVTSLKWIKRVLTSEVYNRRYNFNNLFCSKKMYCGRDHQSWLRSCGSSLLEVLGTHAVCWWLHVAVMRRTDNSAKDVYIPPSDSVPSSGHI